MCIECRQYTCPGSCPNATQDVCGFCDSCNEVIYAGEEVSIVDGTMYHRDCMEFNWDKIFEVTFSIANSGL